MRSWLIFVFPFLIILAACNKMASTSNASMSGPPTSPAPNITESMDNAAASIDDAAASASNAADAAANAAVAAATNAAAASTDTLETVPNPVADGNQTDGNSYCEPVRRSLPVAECARYREQVARLESGVRAFHAPEQMLVGEPSEVRLAIGSAENREEVAATAGGSVTDNRTRIGTTRIGRIMRATLQGSSFEITPVGSAERDLGGTSEEVWIWSVKPRVAGRQVLTAELEVLGEDGTSGRERLAIYRSNASIDVSVTVAQRREAAQQQRLTTLQRLKEVLTSTEGVLGALAAVLAAVGLVVWRLRRIGKDPGQSAATHDAGASPPSPPRPPDS